MITLNFCHRHIKEHSTKTVAMEKENMCGQMDPNSLGHFTWTERKATEFSTLLMAVNLRSIFSIMLIYVNFSFYDQNKLILIKILIKILDIYIYLLPVISYLYYTCLPYVGKSKQNFFFTLKLLWFK